MKTKHSALFVLTVCLSVFFEPLLSCPESDKTPSSHKLMNVIGYNKGGELVTALSVPLHKNEWTFVELDFMIKVPKENSMSSEWHNVRVVFEGYEDISAFREAFFHRSAKKIEEEVLNNLKRVAKEQSWTTISAPHKIRCSKL